MKHVAKEKEVMFSPVEMQVILLVCRELTSKQIALRLRTKYKKEYSPRSVESHRRRILKKMKAKGPVGLVLYAIKHGIIDGKK